MSTPATSTGLALGEQRILFVGGKGGVGKTTTAAALGLRLAHRGERCLVVSTDPAHSLGDVLDRSIGDQETQVAERLFALEIDPDAQVEKHLAAVERTMRGLVEPRLFAEIERQMSLARLSPGAVEAAMLERMADLMIEGPTRYDRIIFDTAPTGHTLRLLSLPEVMAAWTDGLLRQRQRSDSWNKAIKQFGPRPGVGDDMAFLDPPVEAEDPRSTAIRNLLLERRRKFYEARRILLDPGVSAFILVLIPEKLPILESRKAVEALAAVHVPVLGLVVNRVLPPQPLGEFMENRREQEAAYLEQIERAFPRLHRVYVPLLPRDVEDLSSLERIGERLLPD